LVEEGAAIVAFKLVENKVFNEEGISEILRAPGKLSGNSGTRNLSDNISDLRAQVAANKSGVQLMQNLVSSVFMPLSSTPYATLLIIITILISV